MNASVQVSSVLAGTLGFGVKRGDIPGLQHHLLDLDPYADKLTEEFWETVCLLTYCKQLGRNEFGCVDLLLHICMKETVCN